MMQKAGGKVKEAKKIEDDAPPRNVTLLGGAMDSGRISAVAMAGLDGGPGLQEIFSSVAAKQGVPPDGSSQDQQAS